MSEGLAGVIIVCVTLLCITLVISFTKLVLAKEARQADDQSLREQQDARMRERIERAPKPTPGIPWNGAAEMEEQRNRHADETPDDRRMPPLPIDPKNPPKAMVFPHNASDPPNCMCHDRPVQGGQRVYAWPDGPGYRFTCVQEES